MNDPFQNPPCLPGCKAPVPTELVTEGLCVLHFLLFTEKVCSEMKHEAAAGGLLEARRTEIENYVTASAGKLACFATGRLRLSDDMKKRVLTTFHTLMILRENLDRCSSRLSRGLQTPRSVEAPVAFAARG